MAAVDDCSRKTIPSAPTPVPCAQTVLMTSGSAKRPGGSDRASTMTKSLPDPLILKNALPVGITFPSSSTGNEPPRRRHQSQPPHHPDGLPHDGRRHLARSLRPVDEDDRDLANAEALLPSAEAHFDLKGIAIGTDAVEVDCCQHGPAKALEATVTSHTGRPVMALA